MKRRDRYQAMQARTWQMSFNDLMTVLLTFFILLVSISNIRADKVQDLSSSAVKSFGSSTIDDHRANLIRTLSAVKGIEIHTIEGGISIGLPESLLYRSGSAELINKDLLRQLGQHLNTTSKAIRIEGHTDSIPVANNLFASNWELSTQRAVNAVKFLASECNIAPQRLSAAGYADSKPLAPNNTPAGRAINRRVNVIISLQ